MKFSLICRRITASVFSLTLQSWGKIIEIIFVIIIVIFTLLPNYFPGIITFQKLHLNISSSRKGRAWPFSRKKKLLDKSKLTSPSWHLANTGLYTKTKHTQKQALATAYRRRLTVIYVQNIRGNLTKQWDLRLLKPWALQMLGYIGDWTKTNIQSYLNALCHVCNWSAAFYAVSGMQH